MLVMLAGSVGFDAPSDPKLSAMTGAAVYPVGPPVPPWL
jgi:hypothetical protein